MAAKRKGGNGRKKTVLGRIGKENFRQVCFSKCKGGLFSKASTLAMLTGAQLAAVVFSPGGKAFSFGYPSVNAVVNRFMAGDGAEVQGAAADNRLQTLHRLHGEMRKELAERKKGKKRADEALAQERAAGDHQIAAWLHPEVRDMGYEDMAAFAATLMQVQAAVSGRANQVLMEAYNADIRRKRQVPPSPPAPLQIFRARTFELGGSSSANAGIEMQQMQMAMLPPPPQGFTGGVEMEMHPMLMAMQPQPEFAAGTEIEQMLPPVPGLNSVEMVHQVFGPNAGFPY